MKISLSYPIYYQLIHDLIHKHGIHIHSNTNVKPGILELLILSSFCSAYIPSFRSRFAYIFQRSLNSCIETAMVGKSLVDVLSGCFSKSSVTRLETDEIKEYLNSGFEVDLRKNLYLAVYDSIQLKAARSM